MLGVAFMLPACMPTTKAYSGPELPREKVALIVNKKGEPFMSIVAVDGRKGEYKKNIAVKPGKHSVSVNLNSCRPSYSLGPNCDLVLSKILVFEGKAGNTYLVGGSTPLKGIWIEEEETLQVIVDYYLE